MREQSPFKSWRVVTDEQKAWPLEEIFRYAYIEFADDEAWMCADQVEYLTGFSAHQLIGVAKTHGVARTAMASELEFEHTIKGIGQDVEMINMQALVCWAMQHFPDEQCMELLLWSARAISLLSYQHR